MTKKKLDKSPIRLPKALVRKAKAKYVILASLLVAILLIPTTVFFTLAYRTDTTEEITNNFDPKEVVIKIIEDFDGAIKKDVTITNTGEVDAYVRFKITISAIDGDGNVVALPISMINTSDTVADLTYRGIDISDFTIINYVDDNNGENTTDVDSKSWTDSFVEKDGIYYYSSIVKVDEVIDIFDSATFNIPIFDPSVIDLPLPLIDDAGNPYYVFNSDGNLCYQYDKTTGEYTAYLPYIDSNENVLYYTTDGNAAADTNSQYTSLLDEDGTYTYMLSSYTPVLTIVAESIQANGVVEAWGVTLDNDGKITGATAITIEQSDADYSSNPVAQITVSQ